MNPAPPVIRYLAIGPSYRVISKAEFFKIRRIVDIAPIKDDRTLEQFFYPLKIGTAEFVPLGQHQQSGGAILRFIIPLRVLYFVFENLLSFAYRFGIERVNFCARF